MSRKDIYTSKVCPLYSKVYRSLKKYIYSFGFFISMINNIILVYIALIVEIFWGRVILIIPWHYCECRHYYELREGLNEEIQNVKEKLTIHNHNHMGRGILITLSATTIAIAAKYIALSIPTTGGTSCIILTMTTYWTPTIA